MLMWFAWNNALLGRKVGFSVALVAGLAISSGVASAYDKASVANRTGFDIQVEVDYAACRSDTFTVSANASASPSAGRGACLITKITGKMLGAAKTPGAVMGPVTNYDSSGTSYSNFVVQAVPAGGTNYRIWSAQELSAELAKQQASRDVTLATKDSVDPWLIPAVADWMGKLPDATPLHALSVPGTHDTGARFGGAACADQVWTIDKQLDAGIRYLDMRTRRLKAGVFAIHHGPCYQNITFDDVMNQVTAFFKKHPKEFILMNVQEETTAENGSPTFQAIWDAYMTKYPGVFLRSAPKIDDIGNLKLSDVRGKIVALRNADFTGYGTAMNGNDRLEIQNKYMVYFLANDNPFGKDTVSLKQKKDLVAQYITAAGTSTSGKLYINYLSGAYGMIPTDVARATNAVAYQTIGAYNGVKTVGVLLADSPGEGLLFRIVQSNFKSALPN